MKKLLLIFVVIFGFGCRKNPCIYNNCDGEKEPPKQTECYVSKKLVKEFSGGGFTVYDVDTSYYVQCDVKIVGHDSLYRNAGVLNLEPIRYCAAVYNYAVIGAGKDTVVTLNGNPYYCIRVKLHYNPAGDITGDSVLMSFDQQTWNQYKGKEFMYN